MPKIPYLGVSELYKGVHIYKNKKEQKVFRGKICGTISQDLSEERIAAAWVDKVLIKNGKEPVNIFKRV